MACLTPLSLEEAQALGRSYEVEVASVQALQAGSVNSNFKLTLKDGRQVFGRIFEEQGVAGAQRELKLLRELATAGIPGAIPLSLPADTAEPLMHAQKPFALYHWMAGRDLCLDMVTPERARTLGRLLAKVHLASDQFSDLQPGRFGLDSIRRRAAEIRQLTARFNHELEWMLNRLDHYQGLQENTPQGLIHSDLFRDNVLWEGSEISALLDFESASLGLFTYDLMVCVLSWCFGDEFRQEPVSGLLQGYHSERPLSEAEQLQLPIQGALACLRFACTRLTDFELRATQETPPVRDYRRFLQRLRALEAGQLDTVFASLR